MTRPLGGKIHYVSVGVKSMDGSSHGRRRNTNRDVKRLAHNVLIILSHCPERYSPIRTNENHFTVSYTCT